MGKARSETIALAIIENQGKISGIALRGNNQSPELVMVPK